jgi:hypothetical protein
VDKIDRLYAPLWTWWERQHNTETGAVTTRVFKNMSIYELRPDGAYKRQFNGLVADFREETTTRGVKEGRTRLAFGAVTLSRKDRERRLALFGIRLARWSGNESGAR